MTIAFVQGAVATASPGGATATLTLPGNITPGNLLAIVVWVGVSGSSADTISSVTAGSDTATLVDGTDLNNGGVATWKSFYVKNATGGGNTVVANFAAGGDLQRMWVAEFSGVDTVAPLDAHNIAISVAWGSGTDGITLGTTTTTSGDLIVGTCFQGNDDIIPAAGTGYSSSSALAFASGNGDAGRMEYKVAGAAGADTATWSLNGGGATDGNIIIMAFKPPGGATSPPLMAQQWI